MSWSQSGFSILRTTSLRRVAPWAALLLLLGLVGAGILEQRPARAQSTRTGPGQILKVFGLGGVLTADGTLWQYRPDKNVWLTIDEAFRAQGKETKILPLPVRPDEVREMATWGFFVTTAGDCWLYDIDKNRWQQLAPPEK